MNDWITSIFFAHSIDCICVGVYVCVCVYVFSLFFSFFRIIEI